MANPFDKHPNAQKWTTVSVSTYLEQIQRDASDGDSLFLGRALIKLGLYKHIWSYWKKHFHTNEDIFEAMLRIESTFEAKLLDGALRKQISPWVAALTLKNHYNWGNGMSKNKDLLFKVDE